MIDCVVVFGVLLFVVVVGVNGLVEYVFDDFYCCFEKEVFVIDKWFVM